jgi:hypothetical protein
MTKRLFVFVALAVLAAGVPAMATTVSYTTSTPVTSVLTDWSPVKTLAFQQFNTSLGTLNSVTIALSGSLSTVVTVTNNSGSPSNGHANTHLQMTVQDAGLNLINTPQIDMYSPAFNYTNLTGSLTSGTLTKTGSSSDTYSITAILNEFKGIGTTSLNASTFTETTLSNTGGNTAASQVTYASLTGTVTYDYNPVPEPATITLLCTGVLALLRRKSSK